MKKTTLGPDTEQLPHLCLQRSCPNAWQSSSQLGTFYQAEWQKHLQMQSESIKPS